MVVQNGMSTVTMLPSPIITFSIIPISDISTVFEGEAREHRFVTGYMSHTTIIQIPF